MSSLLNLTFFTSWLVFGFIGVFNTYLRSERVWEGALSQTPPWCVLKTHSPSQSSQRPTQTSFGTTECRKQLQKQRLANSCKPSSCEYLRLCNKGSGALATHVTPAAVSVCACACARALTAVKLGWTGSCQGLRLRLRLRGRALQEEWCSIWTARGAHYVEGSKCSPGKEKLFSSQFSISHF